jgi:cytochrome c6
MYVVIFMYSYLKKIISLLLLVVVFSLYITTGAIASPMAEFVSNPISKAIPDSVSNSVEDSTHDLVSGAKIFESNCAGCHINGGNIIRRGKNLKRNALKKYGYNSIEGIVEIVSNGKNNMSAYKSRLSQDEIKSVAIYVLDQAGKDWK